MTDQEELDYLRARVADLEATLGLKNDTLKSIYKLTPAMNGLLNLLIELPFVDDETIKHRLHLAADSKVLVYRLRKELEDKDVEIFSRRGVGWYLTDETKERLRSLTMEVAQAA